MTNPDILAIASIVEKDEERIRAEERRRIYEEYMKAVKADSEASMHGDMFPKNVERFWQELIGENERT